MLHQIVWADVDKVLFKNKLEVVPEKKNLTSLKRKKCDIPVMISFKITPGAAIDVPMVAEQCQLMI
jgi:hypothetical protein